MASGHRYPEAEVVPNQLGAEAQGYPCLLNEVAVERTDCNRRFRTALIAFDLPLEVCLARNAARHRGVPADALRRQFQMFQHTLASVPDEGFDRIFVLNKAEQQSATVEVIPPARRSREKTILQPTQADNLTPDFLN